jgi:hypothetical protein
MLIAIVSMFSVEQWDQVTVSVKLMCSTYGTAFYLTVNMFRVRLEEQGMLERF